MWKRCVIQETRKTKLNLEFSTLCHRASGLLGQCWVCFCLLCVALCLTFQAAQALSCNTYHPHNPTVADYGILLGSWSSGLN